MIRIYQHTIKQLIREQIEELYAGDLSNIDKHNGSVLETVSSGDYEMVLVDIWGAYTVALTHSDLSFFNPDSQNVKRDFEKNPIQKFPLKTFISTLQEWCNKYEEIHIGSYNLEKQEKYVKIIERSKLFDIINRSRNEIVIKNK